MPKLRKIRVHFPWTKTPVKGVFFVPTLNLELTREHGLRAATHHKVQARAEYGVVGGKLGVLFTRVR